MVLLATVSIGTLSIFEKFDFPFYISYCLKKTAPPMNTFDFFTLNQLRKLAFWVPTAPHACPPVMNLFGTDIGLLLSFL